MSEMMSPTPVKLTRSELVFRLAWVALQLLLAYAMAVPGEPFFYQRF